MSDGGGAQSGEWKPPEHFEEYRIVRALGRGAMGSVYLAHDSLLDRPVAVKFIAADDPDADTRDRFFVEARAVARLQHPNVLAIFRVGELRGRPYLVSEFLRGESLDHVKKPLEWQQVLRIGIELSRGLAAAHRRGVLHRDIKPANAMLTEDGGVKLLDFGLAKFLDSAGPSPHATLLGVKSGDLLERSAQGADSAAATRDVVKAAQSLADKLALPAALSPAATVSLPDPVAAASLPQGGAVAYPDTQPQQAQGAAAASLPLGAAVAYPDTQSQQAQGAAAASLPQGAAVAYPDTQPQQAQGGDAASPPQGAAIAYPDTQPQQAQGGAAEAVLPAEAGSQLSGSTFLRPSAANVPVTEPDQVPEFGWADTSITPARRNTMAAPHEGRTAATPVPLRAPVVVTAATLDPAVVSSAQEIELSKRSPSLTGDGAVLGSPLYMAPEAWRADPATPRTDVYSMGVLLYELAAGQSPWHGLSVPQIAASVLQKDPPPLLTRNPRVDPALAAVIDRCIQREPVERYESGEALREALESLAAPAPVTSVLPEGNPYRGLLTFEAEHRALFFGRGAEIRALLDRLRSESRVVVAGDSGVGKSSLCRAGVVPALLDGAMGGEVPTVLRLIPGRHPVASLSAVLSAQLGKDEAEVSAWLHADPSQLGRQLRKSAPKGGLVLFIDQLEELVTLSDPDEARICAEALGSLAISAAGLRVLGTARSDFLGRLAALPGLGDELSRVLYLLKPLGEDGVREAIVAPARAMGFSFETEAMVQSLVSAATKADGSLPLLQFALSELWEARDIQRKLIPAAALERMGGVAGALAEHADRVLHSLVGGQRGAARRLLLKLVTQEGTRARKTEAELVAGDPEARRALEALVHGRLVVARDAEEGEGSYEVAHEALLTGWSTLREWLTRNKETRAARARLEAAASEWLRLGKASEALWSPRQLEEVRTINPEDLGGPEQAFVEASRRGFRRRRLFRWVGVSGAVLGVAGIIGGVQWREQQALRAKVEQRLEQAELQLAAAGSLAVTSGTARERAFQLFNGPDQLAAEDQWSEARRLSGEADQHLYEAEQQLESARSLDPQAEEVIARLAGVTHRRLELAELAFDHQRQVELKRQLLRFDMDGRFRAQLKQPAVLELATGRPGVQVSIEYALKDGPGFGPPRVLGATPLSQVPLDPGSAVLSLSGAGMAAVRYPLLLKPGQQVRLSPRLLPARALPPGYVFVPAGQFLGGSDENDDLRRTFLLSVPMHVRSTGDYLIARDEVTFADWIEFLEALPPEERSRRSPLVPPSRRYMTLELNRSGPGPWVLSMALPSTNHRVAEGELMVFPGRKTLQKVDWRQMPVSGISFSDAEAYAAWLSSSGRVPGARICFEDEWERAVRGADGRPFPCGWTLRPEDANFDETYGRVGTAFGPDPVGAHPSCPSPVGLLDGSGNVWELMRSSNPAAEIVYRGGSFYEGVLSSRVANRNVGDPHLRDIRIGVRMCASPQENP